MRLLFLYQDPRVARLLAPYLPEFRFSPFPVGNHWDLVVRWGNTEGVDWNCRLLNGAHAVRLQRDRDAIKLICSANAIPSSLVFQGYHSSRGLRLSRIVSHYRVDLFDLATVAVYRWDGSRYRRFAWRGNSKLGTIRQLARRALYAAGLHFGSVEVGHTGERALRVLGINPAPSLSPALARAYASFFRSYVQGLEPGSEPGAGGDDSSGYGPEDAQDTAPASSQEVSEVVLGCDPEFVLRKRRSGRLVPASRYFTRSGQVGLDRVGFRVNGVLHHPIAELRPAPSPSPHQVLESLRRAMLRAAYAVRGRGITFQAGSMGARGYPIGGHVHFSNLRPGTDLLRALDNYLALPLFLLEDPKAARARRPRYGTLGDFRMQRHGGFEYRTIPSWIFSPEFALAVLCLAKVIASDYPRLRRNLLADPEDHVSFYRARKEHFRNGFADLWNDLASLPSFYAYRSELDLLRRLVEQGRQWHERNDIKARWLKPTGGEF